MYSTTLALVLAFHILNFAILADAGIFVLKPQSRSTCHGGQTCTIEWLDDGIRPLLTAAGVCTFGLYTGELKLVQALPPADVSTTHTLTFKPNPAAGPNSDAYYIGIISTTAKDNSSAPYIAFSPFFNLDQMTGSFDHPLPEATSSIPIPSSLTHSVSTTTTLSTITVGTLSTSLPPLPTPSNTRPVTSKSLTSLSLPSASSQTRLTTSLLSTPTLISPSGTSSGSRATTAPTPSSNGISKQPIPLSIVVAILGLISPALLTFL